MGVKVELPVPRRGELSPSAVQLQIPSTEAQLSPGGRQGGHPAEAPGERARRTREARGQARLDRKSVV